MWCSEGVTVTECNSALGAPEWNHADVSRRRQSLLMMQLRLYYLEEAFLAEDIQYCILLLSDLVSGGLQARR